jgi:hypothetical protein
MHASPITPTPAGEPIVLQLPPGAALIDLPGPLGHGWLVVEGALRLDTDTSTGGPVQLALPGDSVGFERLFEQASPYAARAVVPTRLHALPAPAQATDGIERARRCAGHALAARHRNGSVAHRPSPRSREVPAGVAGNARPGQDTHALPGLREIASIVDTSPETVSRVFSALRRMQLLDGRKRKRVRYDAEPLARSTLPAGVTRCSASARKPAPVECPAA